ncbi:serine hydrolase domain-containing protein [Actinorugispora endophytica]|uniref:serine hydrolase domain-containing protein n=1 Tax=Actinorugispora endophytica TaxID=1605990 RepID=UPI001FB57339|nr:serine hydrolase domain-containing protein [Actinorugispora endophytica]
MLASTAALGTAALILVQGCVPIDGGEDAGPGPGAAASQESAPPAPRLTPDERVALQQALNEVVTQGSSGAVAELVETGPSGSDSWNGVAGVADRATGEPVDPEARFRIASLSKPFAATVLLQLVGEGEATLDDTVEDHLPGLLVGGDRVTLRMLLSHSSGVYSYSRAMPDVLDARDRVWAPEELVALANERGPVFEPGSRTAYSNTNYVLVAMVIEKITGAPYTRAVQDRVIDRLGLTGTSVPAGTAMPQPVLRAYLPVSQGPGGATAPTDITEFDPSRWYGTAQIVSTVSDVNRFYSALLDGEVLDGEMLAEMLTVRGLDGSGYGYGLGPRQYRLSCDVQVWMHSGHIPGYRTWTVHSETRHLTLFQARYSEDPDPPAWTLIETALCPETGVDGALQSPEEVPGAPDASPDHGTPGA